MKLKFQIRNQSRINKNFRMPQTREERLEYNRQYSINNKEKIAEKNRKYREANKEKIAEYFEANRERRAEIGRKYREANKEKIAERREANKEKTLEYNRKYREANKEKIAKQIAEYREANKEKSADRQRQYRQTPKGKKVQRIGTWKHNGLVDSDNDAYESIYTHYINTQKCENCDVELTEDKNRTPTTKCLDHSHITGLFRNILCNICNIKRGEDKF